MDILIHQNSVKKSILEVDSIQISVLYNILDSANVGLSGIARNILINVDTLTYSEPYILPEEGLKDSKVKRIPQKKVFRENRFKIYPIPAKDYIIIEYVIIGDNPSGKINILDNRGIVVKSSKLAKSFDYKLISISDLPSGIYYCNFISENEIIQTTKLIVTR